MRTTITHRAAVAVEAEEGSSPPLEKKAGGFKRPANMVKLTTWIRAARPKTLLLSFSGVLLGGFLAAKTEFYYVAPIVLASVTAMLLQTLSNFANDYGDFKNGVDGAKRTGPQREMQRGEITEKEMKHAIAVMVVLCLVSGGMLLLSLLLNHASWNQVLVLAGLGIAAILAAMLYTLGRRPYGYRGLGDLFCFLFFGWVAVAGTCYLGSLRFDFSVLLPATAMGFLSNAVLNINNMRDCESDSISGKSSLVVKLGLKKAFIYQCLIIVGAFVCLSAFLILKGTPYHTYAFWLLFPLFLKDLMAIKKTKPEWLDPFLGRQVKHSFLLVLLYGVLLVL